MKKILIITDHKWRDLAGYVYLKLLLERNYNLKVRLCRLGEERFWVLYEKPDLIIYNHLCEDRKVQFAYWLKKQGVRVAILPTEGIFFGDEKDHAAGKFTDFGPVDLYLSWNEPTLQRITELKTLAPEKVKVVGVPRFDFYFPPLSEIMPSKEEIQGKYKLQISRDAPIILCATNFHGASFNSNKAFLYKDWETSKLTRVEGYKPHQIEGLIERDTLSRSLTIESVKRLLGDISNIQIIYRPHPSENHSFYRKIIKELKRKFPGRFAFVVQEYFWDLLNISDVLLQRTCTTAIEAWILGKPTLELQLQPKEFYFCEEQAGGSNIAYSYEDIKEYIAHYTNGGNIPDSMKTYRNDFLKKWWYKLDGKRTQEAAEVIANFLQAHKKARYSFSAGEFLAFYPKEYTKQVLRYGRNFIRKQVVGVDKLGRIDKQFTRKDLKFWEKRLASLHREMGL